MSEVQVDDLTLVPIRQFCLNRALDASTSFGSDKASPEEVIGIAQKFFDFLTKGKVTA